jgi:hypothetical protein
MGDGTVLVELDRSQPMEKLIDGPSFATVNLK